jgi:hypothetical protein
MIIKILQTISNTFSEDGNLESSYSSEHFVIKAEDGKLLKNLKTGEITSSLVCLNKKDKIKNYIEVEVPKAPKEELLETL